MTKGTILTSATVPWHWLFFCPAPKVSTYIRHPEKKNLQSPKWHWLFLPPIGANGYDTTYVGKTKNANLFEGLTYA